MVEFLNFRKADIDLRFTGAAFLGNQFGQPVQGLRAEYDIDIRRTLYNGRTFLAGDAAADANDQIGLEFFQFTHPTQVAKHFLLCFFAYRAGIEQNDIGLFRFVSFFKPFAGMEDVNHFVRVILVHLAAKSLDIKFFCHDKSLGR